MPRDFSALRSAATVLFGVRGTWSYDAWAAINDRFWDGQLQPGAILWGLTAGCDFGSFNPNNNAITLHEALPGTDFAERARALGERDWVMANRAQVFSSWGLPPSSFGAGTALGTLLHETMHQQHDQRGLIDPDWDGHHNAIWAAECERVGEMVGLQPRHWPIYVRRKESIEDVRTRLGSDADGLTSKQLGNRRNWIWVPTIDGVEIAPDAAGRWRGKLVASTDEITGFPRVSFVADGVDVPDRQARILPGWNG